MAARKRSPKKKSAEDQVEPTPPFVMPTMPTVDLEGDDETPASIMQTLAAEVSAKKTDENIMAKLGPAVAAPEPAKAPASAPAPRVPAAVTSAESYVQEAPKPAFTVTLPAPEGVSTPAIVAASGPNVQFSHTFGKYIAPMPAMKVPPRSEVAIAIEVPDVYTTLYLKALYFHATVRSTLLLRKIICEGVNVWPEALFDMGMEGFTAADGNVWLPDNLVARPRQALVVVVYNPTPQTPLITVGGGVLAEFERFAPVNVAAPVGLRPNARGGEA